MNTIVGVAFGRSRSELISTGVLFAAVFLSLALASGVRGIGYYTCSSYCAGPDGDVVDLNPFIYLPYVAAGHGGSIDLGGSANWTLADQFAVTSDLYAWTIVWWIAVSLLVSRPLSAGIIRLRAVRARESRERDDTPR